MRIFKRIVILLTLLLFATYLVLAVTEFNTKPKNLVCKGIQLVFADTVTTGYVNQKEIATLLKEEKVYPVGKRLDQINTKRLEEIIRTHPLIESTECYKSVGQELVIQIIQRYPILRVSSASEEYYIDNQGDVMPLNKNYTSFVPIATGAIEKPFAMTYLYKIALLLHSNQFWNAQIGQIYVIKENQIELIPRVGNHIIYIGDPNELEQKMDRLKRFYERGLNQIGWNKYSRINIEFSNQIICTRKGEEL